MLRVVVLTRSGEIWARRRCYYGEPSESCLRKPGDGRRRSQLGEDLALGLIFVLFDFVLFDHRFGSIFVLFDLHMVQSSFGSFFVLFDLRFGLIIVWFDLRFLQFLFCSIFVLCDLCLV